MVGGVKKTIGKSKDLVEFRQSTREKLKRLIGFMISINSLNRKMLFRFRISTETDSPSTHLVHELCRIRLRERMKRFMKK